MKGKKTKLIGLTAPVSLTVDECRLGLLPTYIHKKGHVGVTSAAAAL